MQYTIEQLDGDELTFMMVDNKWIRIYNGTNYVHTFYVADIDNIVTTLLALQNESLTKQTQ